MLKAACDNSFSPDCEGSTIWVSKDDETNSVYGVQKTFYDGGKIFTTLLLLDYLQLYQHKHRYLAEESYVVREMGGCSMREASTIRITADWRFRLEYYCVHAIAAGGGDHECVLIQIDWIEDSECKGGWWVGGGKEGRPAGRPERTLDRWQHRSLHTPGTVQLEKCKERTGNTSYRLRTSPIYTYLTITKKQCTFYTSKWARISNAF